MHQIHSTFVHQLEIEIYKVLWSPEEKTSPKLQTSWDQAVQINKQPVPICQPDGIIAQILISNQYLFANQMGKIRKILISDQHFLFPDQMGKDLEILLCKLYEV